MPSQITNQKINILTQLNMTKLSLAVSAAIVGSTAAFSLNMKARK